MVELDGGYDSWRVSGIEGVRLFYQHYLWREHLGYELHPSIDLQGRQSIEVAEIGTGHCLWSTQVAKNLGQSCRIIASDINLDRCPPKDLLPRNITLQEWNIWDPVPEDWKGRFDVVHARLIVGAFNDSKDPQPILDKFIMMLKPDGYLQWDEYEYSLDGTGIQYWPAHGPTPSNPPSIDFYQEMVVGFRWPSEFFHSLPDHLRSAAAIDSSSVVLDQRPIGTEVLMAFNEYMIAFTAQIVEVFLKIDPERGQKLKEIRELIFKEELEKGIIACPVPRVTVGRRKGKA